MIKDPYKLGRQLGYLEYMITRYVELLGKPGAIKLFEFNEIPLKKTIRLNSLRSPFHHTIKLLNNKGVLLEDVKGLPEAKIVLKSSVPIGATPEYLNGYYFLQGKNSLYPTIALEPRNSDIIADLAAAPGGKTTHIAQLMNNEGVIFAFELSKNRCRALRSNLARMGVRNTIVFQYDSRHIGEFSKKFDKILLDVPCSGSGVIVSDPSRKHSKTFEDILNYSKYQRTLLKAALKALKPGGSLVYCTCSLEPEENELIIDSILDQDDINIAEINIPGTPGITKFQDYSFSNELRKTKRLYPHETNGEGFYIAKVIKDG